MPGLEDPARASYLDAEQIRRFTQDAADFTGTPGAISDATVQTFLASYPLTFIFKLLEVGGEDSTTECVAIRALERIFESSFGVNLLPQVLPYSKLGLSAASPAVRQLSCKAVKLLLDGTGADVEGAVSAAKEAEVAAPLLSALADSDSGVANVACEALKALARSPAGLELLFTNTGCGQGTFAEMAAKGSATVRMRALSLAAAIAAESEQGATAVAQVGIPAELEQELQLVDNDVLAAVNILEVIKELASSHNGARLVASANVVGRLCSMIRSPESHAMVRSAALTAGAQLLVSKDNKESPLSTEDIRSLVQAVEGFLVTLEDSDRAMFDGEVEATALDTLGQIGASKRGAEALLTVQPPPARHVAAAAFQSTPQAAKHLAAVHALATIAGAEREPEGEGARLSAEAESALRDLIYAAATPSSWGPTVAGVVYALLRQTEEMRIAAYRLVGALLARPWAVQELCTNADIVTHVADPHIETNRPAMEWRHSCCVAMATAADAAEVRGQGKVPGDLRAQLDAAVRRGPYLTGRARGEAVPVVATLERM